jgi:hypothetical protein
MQICAIHASRIDLLVSFGINQGNASLCCVRQTILRPASRFLFSILMVVQPGRPVQTKKNSITCMPGDTTIHFALYLSLMAVNRHRMTFAVSFSAFGTYSDRPSRGGEGDLRTPRRLGLLE